MPHPVVCIFLICALAMHSLVTTNVTPVDILLPSDTGQLLNYAVLCSKLDDGQCKWRLNISSEDNTITTFRISLSTLTLAQPIGQEVVNFSVSFYSNNEENLIKKCDVQSDSCQLSAVKGELILMGVALVDFLDDNKSNGNELQIKLLLNFIARACDCGTTEHKLSESHRDLTIYSPTACNHTAKSCIHHIYSTSLLRIFLTNITNFDHVQVPNKLVIFDGSSIDYDVAIAGLPCGPQAKSLKYICDFTVQSVSSSGNALTVQLLTDGSSDLDIQLDFRAFFAFEVPTVCGPKNFYLSRPIATAVPIVSSNFEFVHDVLGKTCQWDAFGYLTRHLGFQLTDFHLPFLSRLQVNYYSNSTLASCTDYSQDCNGISAGNNLTANLQIGYLGLSVLFSASVHDALLPAPANLSHCYADIVFLIESALFINRSSLLDVAMSMFDQLFLGKGYNRIAVIAFGSDQLTNVFLFNSSFGPADQQFALLQNFPSNPPQSVCADLKLGMGLREAGDIFANTSHDRLKNVIIFSSGCVSMEDNVTDSANALKNSNTTIFAIDFSREPHNFTAENITTNFFRFYNFYGVSTQILNSTINNRCHSQIPTTQHPTGSPPTSTPSTTPPPITCADNKTQTHSDQIAIAFLVEQSQSVQSEFNALKTEWRTIINRTLLLVSDKTWISQYTLAFLNSSVGHVSSQTFDSISQMIDAMNAMPPMQSNQSSVNLYETVSAVQRNATRRLLYIILTKNNATDFATFGSFAEISVARYGSNVILLTSTDLCSSLGQCPFNTLIFSSSGQLLIMQSQSNFSTLAASLASFYRHQLLEFYVQNGGVVEFLVPIDNGLSVMLNIDTYGQFGDNGTFSVFTSDDSGKPKRLLSGDAVVGYVETRYQRMFCIQLHELHTDETAIIIVLHLTGGLNNQVFVLIRGRIAFGFETYIGFSNSSNTDFVEPIPSHAARHLVTSNNNSHISFVFEEVYVVYAGLGFDRPSGQSFFDHRNCSFNQFALSPISWDQSSYLVIRLIGYIGHRQIQRILFVRCDFDFNETTTIATTTLPARTTATTTLPATTTATTTLPARTTATITLPSTGTTTSESTSFSSSNIPSTSLSTTTLTKSSSSTSSRPSTASSRSSTSVTSISTLSPVTTYSVITEHLKQIADEPITGDNVTDVLNYLNRTISGNINRLDENDIYFCSIILNKSAHVHNLDKEDFGLFLSIVDYLLFVDDAKFSLSDDKDRDSTNRILDTFPPLTANSPDKLEYLSGMNVGMTAHTVQCSNVNGQQVATNNNGLSDTGTAFVPNTQSGGQLPVASITITDTAICGANVHKVFYMIFRNRKLFDKDTDQRPRQKRSTDTVKSEQNYEDFCVNKVRVQSYDVVSGTFLTAPNATGRMTSDNFAIVTTFNDTTALVVVQYSLKNWVDPLHGDYGTAWWAGSQWSTSGCTPISSDGGNYIGHCNHLTDFGLIVTGTEKDPALCDKTLRSMGYVLSGSSSLTLFILLGLFVAASVPAMQEIPLLRKLSGSSISNGILGLPYLITLFCYFFFFTIFIDRTVINAGTSLCKAMAAFLYTCLISVVFWTIFQGLEIVKRFFVFTKLGEILEIVTKWQVTGAICIALPISLTVALWFSSNGNFFDRNDCFCWIRPDYIDFAVILPTSLIIIADVVFTALIIQQFFFNGMNNDRYSRQIQSNRAQKRQRTQKVTVIISMQIILGAPWVLQYLTIGTANLTVWHYLFTILNGSQGFLLGVMYLLMRYNRHAALKEQQEISSDYEATRGSRRIGIHHGLARTDTAQEIIIDSPLQSSGDSTSDSRNTATSAARRRILSIDDDDTNGYFS